MENDDKREDMNKKAREIVDEALPADKSYSQILEENALKFIEEHYDEEQRAKILATMERGRDGSIMWKGENGDLVKLKYENGELVRGVLKDKNKDGDYEKVKFKVKDDGYVYKGREVEQGEVRKEKLKLKENDNADEWLDISMRSSESSGLVKEVDKNRVVLNDKEEVVKAKSSSSTTMGTYFGVMYDKETSEYVVDRENGDVISRESKDGVLFSPILGVMAEKEVETERTNQDGETVSNKIKVGANAGLFGVGGGVDVEKSVEDEEGNRKTRGGGVSGGLGYLGVKAEVRGTREDVVVDYSGKSYEESSSFSVGGSLGTRGAGMHVSSDTRVKDVEGNEVVSSQGIGARANILGSGFKIKTSSHYNGENGEKIVESEKGIHLSPLISENRVKNKQKGKIDGEEFDNGFDVGVKNETLKRAERVLRGRGDMEDAVGLMGDGVGLVSKEVSSMIKEGKEFAERVEEKSKAEDARGTVFDEKKEDVNKMEEPGKNKEEIEKIEEKEQNIEAKNLGQEKGNEEKNQPQKMSEQEKSDVKASLKSQALEARNEKSSIGFNEAERAEVKETLKAQAKFSEAESKTDKTIKGIGDEKRVDMGVSERISRFDTKVLDRENIKVENENKAKKQNEAFYRNYARYNAR